MRRAARRSSSRARAVLGGLVGHLAEVEIPPRERGPPAELMSMGIASLVLSWLDSPEIDRDAMTRVWTGC